MNPKPAPATFAAALDAHRATLSEAHRLGAAAARALAEMPAADAACRAAETALSEALERSLTDDAPLSDAQRKKLQTAAAEAESTRRALAAAHAAILAKLTPVEAEIARAATFGLDSLPEHFSSPHVAAFAARVAEVVRVHLWPMVLEAAMLQDATEAAALRDFINSLRVPGIGGPFEPAMLDAGRMDGIDARTTWREVPALVDAHGPLSEAAALRREVRAYVPLATRTEAATPYVRKGYTHDGGVTRDKAAASQLKPATAAHRAPTDAPNSAAVSRLA